MVVAAPFLALAAILPCAQDDEAVAERLRAARQRMRAAREQGRIGEACAIGAASAADAAAASASRPAVEFDLEYARNLVLDDRLEEAAGRFDAAARGADGIGWLEAGAESLSWKGECELRLGDPEAARATFERELELRAEMGDRAGLARAHDDLGRTCGEIGLVADSVAHFESALAEYEALGAELDAAGTRINLGVARLEQGEPELARAALEPALAAMERLGERAGAAHARSNLGQAWRKLGHPAKALECFEAAHAVESELGDEPGATYTLGFLSILQAETGRLDAALESYARVREAFERMGRRGDVAITDGKIGDALTELGRFAEALLAYERALAAHEELGERGAAAGMLTSIGWVESLLGIADRAQARIERAIRIYEELGDAVAAADSRLMLASVWGRAGDLARDAAVLEAALAAIDPDDPADRTRLATTLVNLGAVRLRAGAAEAAKPLLERALELKIEQADRIGRARVVGMLAVTCAQLREDAAAETHFADSLAERRAFGDSYGAAEVLAHVADFELRRGNLAAAIGRARESVELRLRVGEGLGEGGIGLREQAGSAAGTGLLAAAELARGGGAAAERARLDAVWFAEAGRALLLAEAVVHRDALLHAKLASPLAAALDDARAGVRRERASLLAESAQPAADRAAIDASQAALDAACARLEEVEARIEREAREVAEVAMPRPAALSTLRAALPDDGALLTYAEADGRLLALWIDRERVELVEIGGAAEAFAAAQAWLRVVAIAGSDDAPAARRLHELVLAPLAPLMESRSRLVVAPTGVLAFVPFDALLRRDGGRERRLVEELEIACTPSGSVLALLAADAADGASGLLALGGPTPRTGSAPDRALPMAAAEVRSIAALFPEGRRRVLTGNEASVEALRAALDATDGILESVHFACHGRIDARHPRLSGLVLAGGELLGLDEIWRLRVPARLVVLSACDSGRGAIASGEGVLGLVRGFLFAGAQRVLVSDWKVEDAATAEFMAEVYRGLIGERRTAADALRRAKLAALRAGGSRAHPSTWAPFVLWGRSD